MQTIPVEALSQEGNAKSPCDLQQTERYFDRWSRGKHRLYSERSCHPAGHDRNARFLWQPRLLCRGFHLYVCGRKHQLSVLDATNGSVLQQYSLPLAEPLARASAAAIQQNCLIWADSNGIHQIALSGTLQQNLADNRSFALASSSFIVQQIVLDGQGNYWVSGVNAGGQAQIYRYRY